MPETTQILIIGGGSAGICAAIAAAREDCRVVLVEKSRLLGGMGTLAKVHTFCGLYLPDVTKPPQVANPGLPAEIEHKMRHLTGQESPVKMGKVYVLPQEPSLFDQITKQLAAAESEHLDLLFETECLSIRRQTSGKFLAQLGSQHKQWELECDSIIDCSADAVVADHLNLTRTSPPPEKLQRPAFIFSLKQVATDAIDELFRMRLALDMVQAVKSGDLPPAALGASIRNSPTHGECFISIDLDLKDQVWNPGNRQHQQQIRILGEEFSGQFTRFLKTQYPQFSLASEPQMPQNVGIRESYQCSGMYSLSADDLLQGKKFNDVVAFATWPIELRESAKGPRFKFFQNPEPSQIPLACLVSNEMQGLFFAGRCLSASHEAMASVRVMGTCFATGQAAGLAATLFAQGVSDLLTQARQIQQKLGITSD